MKRMIFIDGYSMTARCLSVIKDTIDYQNRLLVDLFVKMYISYMKRYSDFEYSTIVWDTGYEHRRNISQIAFDNGIISKTYKEDRRLKKQREHECDNTVMEKRNAQIESLKDFLSYTNILSVSFGENEADDIIASYCEKYKKEYEIVIFTSDKDYYQLLDDNVKIFDIGKRIEITKYDFISRYMIQPKQWIDVGALAGDSGDTIQGIDGIGEKIALKLIQQYGDWRNAVLSFKNIIEKDRKQYENNCVKYEEKISVAYELKKMILDLDVPALYRRKIDIILLEKIMEDYGLYFYKSNINLFHNKNDEQKNILFTMSNVSDKKFWVCPKCGMQYMSNINNIECENCSVKQLTFSF